MPIFEYRCEVCNQTFECLVIGSDVPNCPHCQGTQIHKLMSACGFLSKGKGGETVSKSAGSSSCTGCHAASCAGCGGS